MTPVTYVRTGAFPV